MTALECTTELIATRGTYADHSQQAEHGQARLASVVVYK